MSMISRSTLVTCALFSVLATACSKGGAGSTGPYAPTQVWTLFSDWGDVAEVTVKPFTNSGTFTENSGSAGWWLHDNVGAPVARMPMNGTIVHDGDHDRWSFTVTVSGGGMSLTGQGVGTTDAPYPVGGSISNGTVTGTVVSSLDPQGAPVSGQWLAYLK